MSVQNDKILPRTCTHASKHRKQEEVQLYLPQHSKSNEGEGLLLPKIPPRGHPFPLISSVHLFRLNDISFLFDAISFLLLPAEISREAILQSFLTLFKKR